MSASGSSAQFGGYVQPSLGEDFDKYAGQMMVAGSQKFAEEQRGPAEGYEVSVSTKHPDAIKVANSGQIHNGFHPDARLLGGMGGTYEDNRRAAEEALFGIPRDADHTQRPVYGYLRHRELPGPYGNVVFDVHPGERRVTTTPGDSLNNFSRTPDEGEDDRSFYEGDVEGLAKDHDSYDHGLHDTYREVQVHGGSIPKAHIKRASVFVHDYEPRIASRAEDRDWETVHNLRSAGIPTRVMGHMEYQPTLDRETLGLGEVGYVDLEAHGSKQYPKPRPR